MGDGLGTGSGKMEAPVPGRDHIWLGGGEGGRKMGDLLEGRSHIGAEGMVADWVG